MTHCIYCNDSGLVPAPCPDCRGHGCTLLSVQGGDAAWHHCEKCQGSGNDPEAAPVPCPHCHELPVILLEDDPKQAAG